MLRFSIHMEYICGAVHLIDGNAPVTDHSSWPGKVMPAKAVRDLQTSRLESSKTGKSTTLFPSVNPFPVICYCTPNPFAKAQRTLPFIKRQARFHRWTYTKRRPGEEIVTGQYQVLVGHVRERESPDPQYYCAVQLGQQLRGELRVPLPARVYRAYLQRH